MGESSQELFGGRFAFVEVLAHNQHCNLSLRPLPRVYFSPQTSASRGVDQAEKAKKLDKYRKLKPQVYTTIMGIALLG